MLAPSHVVPVSTPMDISFHSWCNSIGLAVNPSVQVITSSLSVAGRGVFAVDDLDEGETIARIHSGLVFYPENAEESFPDTAARIRRSKVQAGIHIEDDHATGTEKKRKRFRWIHKLWNKVVQREKLLLQFNFMDIEKTWQPELTLYALAAMEEEHPWSGWISQWKRDDPTHDLFVSNAKPYDEEALNKTANELNAIMPDLENVNLRAGLSIRLGRLAEERSVFSLKDDSETSAMYSILGSRVIGLDGLFDGVIPFHDMVNHSLDPNISMVINGEWIELFAKRKVERGEELFLCYTNIDEPMDENIAMWALIQWGVPTSKSDYMVFDVEEENIKNLSPQEL